MTKRHQDRQGSSYAAWLVDLDGTLYWAKGVKIAMALEVSLFGLHVARRLSRFRAEHETLRREPPDAEGDPFAIQIRRTAKAMAIDPSILERQVRTWMIRRPSRYLALFRRRKLLSEIESFHRAGGKTGLVSDYPAQEKLTALGLRHLFDVVVASGEVPGPRRLKPDPDGYQRAARALSVSPDTCLVIGDRDDADGAAARAAGMDFRKIR